MVKRGAMKKEKGTKWKPRCTTERGLKPAGEVHADRNPNKQEWGGGVQSWGVSQRERFLGCREKKNMGAVRMVGNRNFTKKRWVHEKTEGTRLNGSEGRKARDIRSTKDHKASKKKRSRREGNDKKGRVNVNESWIVTGGQAQWSKKGESEHQKAQLWDEVTWGESKCQNTPKKPVHT